MRTDRLLLLLLGSICCFAEPCKGQDFDVKKISTICEKYLDRLGPASGTVRTSYKTISGPNIDSAKQVDFDFGKDRRYLRTVLQLPASAKGPATDIGFVSNPQYSFEVSKLNTDAVWNLAGVVDHSSQSDDSIKRFLAKVSGMEHHARPGFILIGGGLVDLLRSPSFRILSAKELVLDGKKFTRVEFNNAHSIDEGDIRIQEGELVLDPNAGWIIKSAIVKLRYSNCDQQSKTTNDYNVDTDGVPTDCRVVHLVETTAGEGKGEAYRLEVDLRMQRGQPSASNELFMLSGFGLPEPARQSSFPISVNVAVGVVGAVLIALGLYLRKRVSS